MKRHQFTITFFKGGYNQLERLEKYTGLKSKLIIITRALDLYEQAVKAVKP
jgi:hypothetical protein